MAWNNCWLHSVNVADNLSYPKRFTCSFSALHFWHDLRGFSTRILPSSHIIYR